VRRIRAVGARLRTTNGKVSPGMWPVR